MSESGKPAGVAGLSAEPNYSGLGRAEQRRAIGVVDILCSQVASDEFVPTRIVMPSALDDATRRVLELRRRDGYRVPEFVQFSGHAKRRIANGADPKAFVNGGQVVSSAGENLPVPPWTLREYGYLAGGLAACIFIAGAVLTLLLVVGAHAFGIGDDGLRVLMMGAIGVVPTASALGGVSQAVRMFFENRACVLSREEALRYHLSVEQFDEIRRTAAPVDAQWSEIKLAVVASRLAAKIETSTAWTDTVLDEHRIVFSPNREADQILAHAMQIASMRARLGEAPVGDTSDHEKARAALQLEHDLLDQIVQSLRERVAALWSYATNVEELSSQIEALRAIENSMTLAPELDTLARQAGLDEMATRQLNALSADAETISVKIAAITTALSNALVPLSLNEAHQHGGVI